MKACEKTEELPPDVSIDPEEMFNVIGHYYSTTLYISGTWVWVDSRKMGEPIELSMLFNLVRNAMWKAINELN